MASAITASVLTANPAQAVRISGIPIYTPSGALPTTLSVKDQFNNGVLTGGFTDVSNIKVGELDLLAGSSAGSGFNANYAFRENFISGFTFGGVAAYFDLFAGDTVVHTFIPGALTFTIAADFAGVIRSDASKEALAFGFGTFSADATSLSNSYSLNLIAKPIPTPALLPGLVSLGVAALRRKDDNTVEENV